jgi:hypothetical protein
VTASRSLDVRPWRRNDPGLRLDCGRRAEWCSGSLAEVDALRVHQPLLEAGVPLVRRPCDAPPTVPLVRRVVGRTTVLPVAAIGMSRRRTCELRRRDRHEHERKTELQVHATIVTAELRPGAQRTPLTSPGTRSVTRVDWEVRGRGRSKDRHPPGPLTPHQLWSSRTCFSPPERPEFPNVRSAGLRVRGRAASAHRRGRRSASHPSGTVRGVARGSRRLKVQAPQALLHQLRLPDIRVWRGSGGRAASLSMG